MHTGIFRDFIHGPAWYISDGVTPWCFAASIHILQFPSQSACKDRRLRVKDFGRFVILHVELVPGKYSRCIRSNTIFRYTYFLRIFYKTKMILVLKLLLLILPICFSVAHFWYILNIYISHSGQVSSAPCGGRRLIEMWKNSSLAVMSENSRQPEIPPAPIKVIKICWTIVS